MKNITNRHVHIESANVESHFGNDTDAFFILNTDFNFLYLNPQAERLLMLDKVKAIGKNIWDLLPISTRSPLPKILTNALSGRVKTIDTYLWPSNLRWYTISAFPLGNELILHFTELKEKVLLPKKKQKNIVHLKTILDSIPQITFTAKPNGEIEYWNKKWEEYTGLPIQEGLFSFWEQAIHPDDLAHTKDLWQKALYTGTTYEIKYRMRRADGTYRWHLERGMPIKDKYNRIKMWVGTATDIQDLKQVLEQLEESESIRKQNQFMQSLLRQKDEFLSIASHELKTPVTSMKASLQILKRLIERKDEPTVLIPVLERAIRQIDKIIDLISDLLDVTKIQAGKLKLHINTFGIDEIITDSIYQQSNSHHIEVTNTVREPIQGDKMRIEQVLINYLSNAVKYSPNAKEILLSAKKEGDFAKISVTDFGIGIPKDKLNNIFQRFYRVDELSPQFTGLGLGLYISAEIIKAHHGHWGVESEEGKGSTFWFTIPFKARYVDTDESCESP